MTVGRKRGVCENRSHIFESKVLVEDVLNRLALGDSCKLIEE